MSLNNYLRQIRHRNFVDKNGLFIPRHIADEKKASWPVCQTCHRDVDRVQVEDIGKHTVTIRAWCHDKEDAVKLTFPYSTLNDKDDWQHINHAFNTMTFFEPSIA